MTIRFRYHPEARAELDEAVDWYEEAAAGLGGDFFNEVEAAVRSACEHPTQSPLFAGVDPTLVVHRKSLRRFPYSVAWLVEPTGIVIVAVAHGRRRPGYWLDRIATTT